MDGCVCGIAVQFVLVNIRLDGCVGGIAIQLVLVNIRLDGCVCGIAVQFVLVNIRLDGGVGCVHLTYGCCVIISKTDSNTVDLLTGVVDPVGRGLSFDSQIAARTVCGIFIAQIRVQGEESCR